MKTKIYDKVKWHFPEGKNCPSIDAAMHHFKEVAAWLQSKELLSDYGKSIVSGGVDDDFSLTSEMVTDRGRAVLDATYEKWLETVVYGQPSDLSPLDKSLSQK